MQDARAGDAQAAEPGDQRANDKRASADNTGARLQSGRALRMAFVLDVAFAIPVTRYEPNNDSQLAESLIYATQKIPVVTAFVASTADQKKEFIAVTKRLKLLTDRREQILARVGDDYVVAPPKLPTKP